MKVLIACEESQHVCMAFVVLANLKSTSVLAMGGQLK